MSGAKRGRRPAEETNGGGAPTDGNSCPHLDKLLHRKKPEASMRFLGELWRAFATWAQETEDREEEGWAMLRCATCGHGGEPPCAARKESEEEDAHALKLDTTAHELLCWPCRRYVFSPETDAVRAHALYDASRRAAERPPGAELRSHVRAGPLVLRGMSNLGSTCFMNSVLQFLVHAPRIRDFFLGGAHARTCSILATIRQQQQLRGGAEGSTRSSSGISQHSPASSPTRKHASGTDASTALARLAEEAHVARYPTLWHRSYAGSAPPQDAAPAAGSEDVASCFGCELDEFLAELCCPRNPLETRFPVSNHRTLNALWEHSPALAGYLQQDAQEFYGTFVNALHAHTSVGGGDDATWRSSSLISPRSGIKRTKLTEASVPTCECVVHSNLGGTIESSLACATCGKSSSTFEPFLDLSLDVPESAAADLTHCFEAFSRTERLTLDERVTCDGDCASLQDGLKKMSIHRAPPLLVLHLKRFGADPATNGLRKLDTRVSFPLTGLDLAPYCGDGHAAAAGDLVYDLHAVVQHSGKLGGGHYISFVKVEGLDWFQFDDSFVTRATEAQVVNAQAYMLCYARRPSGGA